MQTFLWPAEDGWPYPDTGPEASDLGAEPDDDLMSVLAASRHLLDGLDPRECLVVSRHYGLDGQVPWNMKQLHSETGLSREQLREALGSGLAKLRTHLQA